VATALHQGIITRQHIATLMSSDADRTGRIHACQENRAATFNSPTILAETYAGSRAAPRRSRRGSRQRAAPFGKSIMLVDALEVDLFPMTKVSSGKR